MALDLLFVTIMYRSDARKSKVETAARNHPTKVTVESVDPEEGFLLSGPAAVLRNELNKPSYGIFLHREKQKFDG